jgi:hypothetical protein
MSSAAGEEGGAAAVPTQGPVPVERVKAANGLEKVVLREVRGNTVEVRYCSLPLSPSVPPGRCFRGQISVQIRGACSGSRSNVCNRFSPIPIIFQLQVLL